MDGSDYLLEPLTRRETAFVGGTVTFLFTDIEGSTKLWQRHPEAMRVSLRQHDTLLRRAIDENGKQVE